MEIKLCILLLSSLLLVVRADFDWDDIPNWWDEDSFVPPNGPVEERSRAFWENHGQNLLRQKAEQKLNVNKAKNLIIFIGDGMGISTQTATRAYMGNENMEMAFEKFPFAGLSKPYCINYKVPDSSCTATAILTGIKTNYGVISMTGNVSLRDCAGQQNTNNHVDSIFKYAQDAGKATGFVTTTRITHATPAAIYAKSSVRQWESNEFVPEGCHDIAHQLVQGEIGSRIDVAMGGGRRHFLPNTHINQPGFRTDNRNLLDEYLQLNVNKRAAIVQSRDELFSLNTANTDKILGVFAQSHFEFKLHATEQLNQPTLLEMTIKALEVLKKNDNGFVLLVEGGRIDHAHHITSAQLALEETVEFDKAVEYARNVTNEEDTLILVTADHGHPFTIGGYSPRGRNILGVSDWSRTDQMWFFTLNYANGPGYHDHAMPGGGRRDPRNMDYMNPSFRQPTTLPKEEETHSGEDVGVFTSGPWAHLFSGVYEQSYIAHALMYATCIGPEGFLRNPQCTGSATMKSFSLWLLIAALIIAILR